MTDEEVNPDQVDGQPPTESSRRRHGIVQGLTAPPKF